MTRFLNFLARNGWYIVLKYWISIMYFVKGNGLVKVKYHPTFRAWEYRIKNVSYLSTGPGWAYSYDYLNQLLLDTYFKYYVPKSGDCIVDLGAGLGEESMIFAQQVGKNGIVHAIEANPVTYTALEYVSKINHFDQIKTHQFAIAEKTKKVFIENNDSYVSDTINKSTSTAQQIEIQAFSFDDFVTQQGIKQIDLLKSNIEGAEQYLVAGINHSIDKIRMAAISCHDFRHTHNGEEEFYVTQEKVINFFKVHDFEIILNNTGHVINDCYVYAINRKPISQ